MGLNSDEDRLIRFDVAFHYRNVIMTIEFVVKHVDGKTAAISGWQHCPRLFFNERLVLQTELNQAFDGADFYIVLFRKR